MKRSTINALIKEAEGIFRENGWHLPAFAGYTPAKWREKGREADAIRQCALGWDITDFGSGDYDKVGLFLFTLRNGNYHDPSNKKPYAEKLMLVKENQVTPCHFHWSKMEDIINRGGGNLMVKLYNATEDEKLGDTPVTVMQDGEEHTYPAGSVLRIEPGCSITMHQRLYHAFWGEEGHGPVVVGEVSMVNDDNTDNRFYDPTGRFPDIEEDEAPYRLLCNEYPSAR